MTEKFTISAYPQNFRLKKMNAIEFFALRTQIDFENYESSLSAFNLMLEKIEVQVDDDNWLPVKEGKNYFPAGIEDNVQAVDELVSKFMKEFRQVFTKSNASKKKQAE